MPTPRHQAIGISVAGIGEEGSGFSGTLTNADGYLWATDGADTVSAGVPAMSDYDIRTVLKLDGLGSIPAKSKPFSAQTQWSGYDFQIEATNFAAEKWLYEQKRADSTVASDFSASDTTIDLQSTSLGDTVIYVGDETILTGAHQGGGTYDNCKRGIYGSSAQRHRSGDNVYTSVPSWSERRVTLYTYDVESGKVQRWIGRIAESITQDKGTITVPCDQHIAGVAGKRGFESRDLEPESAFYKGRGRLSDFDRTAAQIGYQTDYEPKILKPTTKASATETVSGDQALYFAMQIGGQIVPYYAKVDADGYTGVVESYSGTDSRRYPMPFYGNEFDIDLNDNGKVPSGTQPDKKGIHEVFAVDRNRQFTPLQPLAESYSFVTLYHPLAYWACFALSSPGDIDTANFDIFQSDWALDAGEYFGSGIVQDIIDLIDATPEYQVDRFVLGYDGEPVELWKTINKKFLHPYGFYIGVDDQGNATVEQIGAIGVETFDAAKGNQINAQPSDVLSFDSGRSQTVDAIKATVGKTPVTEGDTIFVSARGGDSQRAARNSGSADLELDLSTVDPDRASEVREKLIGRVILQHFSIPRLRVSAKDQAAEALDYSIGAEVTIADLPLKPEWLVTKDGERIEVIDDDVEFSGYIVGRQFHPRRRAYDLDIMLIGDVLIRWRAPSGWIVDTDEANNRINLGDGSGDPSAFLSGSAATPDAEYFEVGDDVELWNQDGTRWSSTSGEIREIDNVSTASNYIELKSFFSSDPAAATTTKVLRLAHGDTDDSGTGYSNDGLDGAFQHIERAYVLLADASDTIGDAATEADEYGA